MRQWGNGAMPVLATVQTAAGVEKGAPVNQSLTERQSDL